MITALTGKAGSGKNAAASSLYWQLEHVKIEIIAFADPLKDICRDVFEFTNDQLHDAEKKGKADPRYPGLTPRYAMQLLGTEWGRRCYPDVWVDYAMRRARRFQDEGTQLVLITDCRFVNEAKAVRAAGGEVWRVYRTDAWIAGGIAGHPSEVEQDSEDMSALVNRTLSNLGGLADLDREVSDAIQHTPLLKDLLYP